MNKLKISYSKRKRDFLITYPCSSDGHFINQLLKPWQIIHPSSLVDMSKSWSEQGYSEIKSYRGALGAYSLIEIKWVEELERRGYDLKTLKFEISKKHCEELG